MDMETGARFMVFSIYCEVYLLKDAEHTFIRKTLKHLPFSFYNLAMCTLKWCAGILIKLDIIR